MGAIANKLGYAVVNQAAAALIKTGPTGFYGLAVVASTSGTVSVYDGTSASGTLIFAKAGLTVGDVIHFGGNGVAAKNGLYVSCGGTATVTVFYI